MKNCPVMSYRDSSCHEVWCYGSDCAWWNEEQKCCAIVAEKRVKPIICMGKSYFKPPVTVQ